MVPVFTNPVFFDVVIEGVRGVKVIRIREWRMKKTSTKEVEVE